MTQGILYKMRKSRRSPKATPAIRATPKDAMKLRKTGFESLRPFVIHRAKHTSKGVARHWNEKLVSAFHNF